MKLLKRLKNLKGFTFIEMVVGFSLFTMIMSVMFSASNAVQNVFNVQQVTRQLTHDGLQTLRYVADEIAQTNPIDSDGQLVITAGASYDEVRFRIPVDWDNDGDVVLDGEYDEFEWGAWAIIVNNSGKTKTKVFKNNWIRYRVIEQNSNKILVREVLKPDLVKRGSKYTKEVAYNVDSFKITKDGSLVVVSISFEETDEIGQFGKSRDYSQSYVMSTQTLLRNTVQQDSGDDGNGGDPDE